MNTKELDEWLQSGEYARLTRERLGKETRGIRIPVLEANGTPMTGERLRIAQSLNDFLNMIGFPRIGRSEPMSATQEDVDELRRIADLTQPYKEVEMARKIARGKLLDEMTEVLETAIEQHKAFIDEERGAFHRMTGVRDTIEKLYKIGAIHPDFASSIGAWMQEGGYATLQIGGVTVVKGGR